MNKFHARSFRMCKCACDCTPRELWWWWLWLWWWCGRELCICVVCLGEGIEVKGTQHLPHKMIFCGFRPNNANDLERFAPRPAIAGPVSARGQSRTVEDTRLGGRRTNLP